MVIATTLSGVASLVSAVAWPLVVVIAVFVLRRPLGVLARRVARGLTKLSIGSVSIELSQDGRGSVQAIDEIRDPVTFNQSKPPALVEELSRREPLPYAVVNLGRGRRWLSTRLYLLTVLLTRTRQLKTLVFLATKEEIPERFVGLVDADALVRTLAARQPWLEYRLMEAYSPYMKQHAGNPQTQTGPWTEGQAAVAFVQGVQKVLPDESTAQQDSPPEGWVLRKGEEGQSVLEHADWVSAESLTALLGDDLDSGAYVAERTLLDADSRNRAVLGLQNRDDVVVVDERHRFRGRLIRRRAALEQIAAEAADAL